MPQPQSGRRARASARLCAVPAPRAPRRAAPRTAARGRSPREFASERGEVSCRSSASRKAVPAPPARLGSPRPREVTSFGLGHVCGEACELEIRGAETAGSRVAPTVRAGSGWAGKCILTFPGTSPLLISRGIFFFRPILFQHSLPASPPVGTHFHPLYWTCWSGGVGRSGRWRGYGDFESDGGGRVPELISYPCWISGPWRGTWSQESSTCLHCGTQVGKRTPERTVLSF